MYMYENGFCRLPTHPLHSFLLPTVLLLTISHSLSFSFPPFLPPRCVAGMNIFWVITVSLGTRYVVFHLPLFHSCLPCSFSSPSLSCSLPNFPPSPPSLPTFLSLPPSLPTFSPSLLPSLPPYLPSLPSLPPLPPSLPSLPPSLPPLPPSLPSLPPYLPSLPLLPPFLPFLSLPPPPSPPPFHVTLLLPSLLVH